MNARYRESRAVMNSKPNSGRSQAHSRIVEYLRLFFAYHYIHMARVRVNIERKSDADYITFMDDCGNRTYGRKCRFSNKDTVFEMLRRGGAAESLCSIVEGDLQRTGSSVVVLNLTHEQYAKIKDGR